MYNQTLKIRGLVVGDLVYHLLYGKDWRAILMGSSLEDSGLTNPDEKALVFMMPGTRYENYFKKNYLTNSRVHGNLGYVSSKWIYRLEIK